MENWKRIEFKTGVTCKTTFQLMNVGDEVEFETEERVGTYDKLVWINLNEKEVDQVIAFLQEWKEGRNG